MVPSSRMLFIGAPRKKAPVAEREGGAGTSASSKIKNGSSQTRQVRAGRTRERSALLGEVPFEARDVLRRALAER